MGVECMGACMGVLSVWGLYGGVKYMGACMGPYVGVKCMGPLCEGIGHVC